MFRYMTFVWQPENVDQSEAAQLLGRCLKSSSSDWDDVVNFNGLRVMCAGVRPGGIESYKLHNKSGVVLGTLFDRAETSSIPATPRRAVIGERETSVIMSSRGRALTESYWGRYVAFLLDPAAQKKWIVHDPTSNLPCLYTTFRDVRLFFSCVADCARMGAIQLSIDWQFVRARVATGPLFLGGTGLEEVEEVNRGECIEVDGKSLSRRFYWNPVEISRSNAVEDPSEATRALRATAKTCAHAWASRYERSIHRLSGGLDSSIVLGCLRDAPNRSSITCITYYIPGGHADERPWARLAASEAGCEHIEHPRSPHVDLPKIFQIEPSVRPHDLTPYIELAPVERRLAFERHATALFTGHGGDPLFGKHSQDFMADDYVHRRGVRPRLLHVAADAALLANTSVWSVLAACARRKLSRKRFGAVEEQIVRARQLVCADVTAAALQQTLVPHPWFQSTDLPWGLIKQLGGLIESPSFYDPLSHPDAPDLEKVDPLLSQPFVELCLRIPLYIHLEGGRDRGLARRAFASDVHEEIINRHWKDRAPRFFEDILRCNHTFVRDSLLGGILTQERLLDVRSLEKSLAGLRTKSSAFIGEIFDHLFLEAWLRSWTQGRLRAAA